ncbi:Eukaryotic translation initiation factor 5A-2 [Frankliniella fusca]|uniref:Eukaryotic translation initiation factor 5A-2 n=1 Tax=Frankliniella fusca TaxID=407009 RepID=A0AAE1HH16_9NEOP|nr:Eukaryotic translation initiation factor 5A-2 [Frankliniella fusca]
MVWAAGAGRGRGRGRRGAALREQAEHLPGLWCAGASMVSLASVLSVASAVLSAVAPENNTDRAASPSSGYGSDFSCSGDVDDGADVWEERPVSPADSSSSSSGGSGGSDTTWDAVEVSNGRWASMGILPTWSIWTPTNLDDPLLDQLATRKTSGSSSGSLRPEAEQDQEQGQGLEQDDDPLDLDLTPAKLSLPLCEQAEQAEAEVDWGQFGDWTPVPTPTEAEALAAAAAQEEAARRELAAQKKRERAAKFGKLKPKRRQRADA